jgi:LAO/AO transport system kinase
MKKVGEFFILHSSFFIRNSKFFILMSDTDSLSQAVLSGQFRALARAVSLVERGHPDAARLLADIYPATGNARIVGITGSPGSGKSTLVAALAKHYRKQGKRVGIIAVDPTSPFSGGAILGDRIRMADLYTDRGVFIRSMATRGFLGGLAKATNDVVDLLDASGFDMVLVETVGVGQDEVEVIRTVQTNVVVLVPGMGDDIQAIKAGIMEIGDIFVVNKADRPGADKTVTEVTMMMSLVEEHGDWVPPIVKTTASRAEGIVELDAAIRRHYDYLVSSGELDRRNRERVRIRIETLLKEKFMDRLIGHTLAPRDYEQLLEDVLRKRNNPHDAVEGVLTRVQF